VARLDRNSASTEFKFTEINRYQRAAAVRLPASTARMSTPLRRELEPIKLLYLAYILGSEEAAGDVDLIVVAAQKKISAEVEFLLSATRALPLSARRLSSLLSRSLLRTSRMPFEAASAPGLFALDLPKALLGQLQPVTPMPERAVYGSIQ
jgi:hypothetical protein